MKRGTLDEEANQKRRRLLLSFERSAAFRFKTIFNDVNLHYDVSRSPTHPFVLLLSRDRACYRATVIVRMGGLYDSRR